MSIASEVARLVSAKAALKSSIEGKGVTVPSTTTLDGYAALVGQISAGASNCVAGTFQGSSTGKLTVPLDYSGNGYPIAVLILTGDALDDHAVDTWMMVKNALSIAPMYIGNVQADVSWGVLRDSEVEEFWSGGYNYTTSASYPSLGNDGGYLAVIRSAQEMEVYIGSYGFQNGVEYTYCVIYSD